MRLSIAALGLASMLALAAAAPAAALTFKGTGFYARFGPSMATDVRGLVIGDRTSGDSPRLNVGLVGLLPHIEFTIVGRSIGCNGTPSGSNRAFRLDATADAHGDWFATGILAEWSRTDVNSVWINWGDGATCVPAVQFVRVATGDVNGDGGLALTKVGAGTLILLLERRPNDGARLSIVVNGLQGGDDHRFRFVDEPCGSNGDTLAAVTFSDLEISDFRSVVVGPGGEEIFADRYASVRVRSLAGNNTYCGTTTIFDVKQ